MSRISAFVLAIFVLLAGSASHAADKISIAMVKPGMASPMIVALESGAFENEGLDVEIISTASSTAVSVAVASGDAQFGATAFSAAFYNLAGKGVLRVIGGSNRDEAGYKLMAYVVTPEAYEAGFRHPRDIVGHKVAISTLGSPTHYAVSALAAKYNLDMDAINLVPVQSITNTIGAIKGKRVDATILPAALANIVVKSGGGRIIGWVSDETPMQFGGIFTTTEMISKNRDLVERFMRAYRVGGHLFHQAFLQRDEAGRPVKGENYDHYVGLMAKRMGASKRRVEAMLAFYDQDARLRVRDVANQIRGYQELGLVYDTVDVHQVLDLSFVQHLDLIN
jgi:NitT/TauT family transport system substrate-binding protein